VIIGDKELRESAEVVDGFDAGERGAEALLEHYGVDPDAAMNYAAAVDEFTIERIEQGGDAEAIRQSGIIMGLLVGIELCK
jgi:hypothetical protein